MFVQVAAGQLSSDVLLEESGEIVDVEGELLLPDDMEVSSCERAPAGLGAACGLQPEVAGGHAPGAVANPNSDGRAQGLGGAGSQQSRDGQAASQLKRRCLRRHCCWLVGCGDCRVLLGRRAMPEGELLLLVVVVAFSLYPCAALSLFLPRLQPPRRPSR